MDIHIAVMNLTNEPLKVWYKEQTELEKYRTTEEQAKRNIDKKPKGPCKYIIFGPDESEEENKEFH